MSLPITYSSEISLSIAKHPTVYLYTDGFMKTSLELNSFHKLHGNLFNDFHNAVFRVLPVINYKWTDQILTDVVQNDFQKLQTEPLVKERKNIVQGYISNLDGEVISNIALAQKMKATPLVFVSSQFHLVHVSSLKFLSLNDDNTESLFYELVDFPSQGSVLRFIPCLQFQKLRTNVIFHGDPVILTSVKTVCNRPPQLYILSFESRCTSFQGLKYDQQMENVDANDVEFNKELEHSRIWASVEEHTRWRVNAFYAVGQHDRERAAEDYLHVGDVIALNLSEMSMYLNVQKPYDTSKRILDILIEEDKLPEEQQNVQDSGSGSVLNITNPSQPGRKLTQREQKKELLKRTNTTRANRKLAEKVDDIAILKQILSDDVIISFVDILKGQQGQVTRKTMTAIPNSCYWKIEADKFQEGGKVAWDKSYRLRHYLTGRYLKLIVKEKGVSHAILTSSAGSDTLFRFCPIENAEMKQGKFLWKDSFFYFMHMETSKYLGITDEDEIEDPPELVAAQKALDMEMSQPYLSVVQNHYNTYRMKRVDFIDTWETSMLLYSVPFFMEAVNFINTLNKQAKMLNEQTRTDEDIRSKIHFYRIHQRVLTTLDNFIAFVNNKMISNISNYQEYSMIVPQRQTIIRQQNVFVLLCWLLYRAFPNADEMREMGEISYNQLIMDFLDEKDFMIRAESFLMNGTIYEHKKALQRLDSHHLKRKMLISFKIYLAIKEICKLNHENQMTLMKFINIMQRHIGYGEEIVNTLISGFSSNDKILHSLAQLEIQLVRKETLPASAGGPVNNDTGQSGGDQTITINFLTGLVYKILDFPQYSHPDIICFLSSLCSLDDEPLFVNQDMIFRALIQNRELSRKALMTITFQDGKDLYIEYLDRDSNMQYKKLPEFLDESNSDGNPNFLRQYVYLRNQLDLFANLCLHRNVLACSTFSQIFQLNVLIKYVLSDRFDNEIRAVFQRLIRTLYIDREPYNIQHKPVLVRIVQYDKASLIPDYYEEQKFLWFFKRKVKVPQKPVSPPQEKTLQTGQSKISKVFSNRTPGSALIPAQSRILDQRSRLIQPSKIVAPMSQIPTPTPTPGQPTISEEAEDAEERLTAREEENIHLVLNGFKIDLLEYIREKYELLQSHTATYKVYNVLTYEIIKILEIIMKFGLFWTRIDKPKRLNRPRSETLRRIFERAYMKKVNDFEQQMKESQMEKLINYLTYFLEYDENYFIAINTVNLQRKYIEHRKIRDEQQQQKGLLTGISNLGRGLTSLSSMFTVDDQVQKKEKRVIQAVSYESDVITDPLFKKIKALKKILQKSSNKTFTIKEESNDTNYEVLIKGQICKIFSYLLDVRQDYLVDNLLGYFQSEFVPRVVNHHDEANTLDWDKDFLSMLPEDQIEVGASFTGKKQMAEYVDHPPIVRNFDAIVDRSFYETLVFALYFSTDAQLQNEIVDLVQKYTSQKRQFRENIQHLQLMLAPEIIEFFRDWNQLLERIKKIILKCQAWLNLGTPAKQNQRNEANIKRCIAMLEELKRRFWKNYLDSRALKTKQRIFMHVGAFQNLFYLMINCQRMIDSHKHIFRFPDTEDDAVFYQITLAKLVVQLLTLVVDIYTIFIYLNFENQLLIQKQVVPAITQYVHQNFGQVQFLIELFRDNHKLVEQMDRTRVFGFVIELIITHGRYPEFLEVFHIVLASIQDLSVEPELPKEVLAHLIDHHTFDKLNPFTDQINQQQEFFQLRYTGFFPHEPDIPEYRTMFFLILARCLRVEVSVNHIQHVKVFVKMNDLLAFIIEKSKELLMSNSQYHVFNKLLIKSSIIDIIMILVQKTQGSLSDLIEQGQLVQEFIELEIRTIEGRTIFNENMQDYLFHKQLPLILKYIEAFFQDASTQLFSASETQKKDRKRLYIYGQTFLKATLYMSSADIAKEPKKVNMLKRLCSILNMDMVPQIASHEKSGIEQIESENNEDAILITVLNDEQIHEQFDQALLEKNNPEAEKKSHNVELHQGKSVKGLLNRFKNKLKPDTPVTSGVLSADPRRGREFLIDDDSKKMIELWNIYSSILADSEVLKEAVKHEPLTFSTSLWNVSAMFQSEIKGDQKELLLNSEDIIVKLLYFIEYWKQNRAEKRNVIFVLQILAKILNGAITGENEDDDTEELKTRQEMFDKLNATKILMQLLWNENEVEHDYLKYLLKLFIALLRGGNRTVQKTIYDYVLSNSECEKFFYKLHSILMMNPSSHKDEGSIQYKCMAKALRLIQLLCEGHNHDLQQYLHHQTNSKNNYDLVVMCVRLLSNLCINPLNYDIVVQCFETITETLQGPCKANQIAIGNSKFLEYAVSILAEDEKVFECKVEEHHAEAKLVDVMMSSAAAKKFKQVKGIQKLMKEHVDHQKTRHKLLDPDQHYAIIIHPGKLARLKYKVLISVVALLECNDLGDNFLLRVIRSIPLPVLTENLLHIYQLYDKYKTKDGYEESLFCRFDQHINPSKDDDYFELIIEQGFMIYTLMQIFLNNKKGRDILYEDIDMREILNQFKEDMEDSGSLLQSFGKIGGLMKSGFGGLTKGLDNALKSDEEKKKDEERERKAAKKEKLIAAIEFFKKNTKQIEILRGDKISTVYFPKLPFCHKLPKDLKQEFHDQVNRKSTKSKLTALMNTTEQFVNTMIHEERLRKLFNYNPLFGFFADNGKLWEQLAFINVFIINIIICASYSQYFMDPKITDKSPNYKLYQPRFLFQKENTQTFQLIRVFGIIELVLASLIVFFFVIKRAPLKIYDVWKGFTSTKGFFKIVFMAIFRAFKSLFILLQDFDILYYTIYILAGIVGLFFHPFVFAVHLMDCLKLDQLKTVVQAIWKPKIELGLTMMLMLILQYYFTIIGWVYFYMDYDIHNVFEETKDYQHFCTEFWICYVSTFSWTFNQGGAIGSTLADPGTAEYEGITSVDDYNNVNQHLVSKYVSRFIFDNIFNIILVFILLNMIQGIIIDTFSNLREELAEKLYDQDYICFVCGIDLEKLDKSSESDKGFKYHIKIEHYMWDYLFYRAYIEQKDPTEFDGNESFVMDRIKNSDLSWFPIGRAKCVVDEEQEDTIRNEMLIVLNNKGSKVEADMKRTCQRAEHVRTQLGLIFEEEV